MKKVICLILGVLTSVTIFGGVLLADNLLSLLEDIQSSSTVFQGYSSTKKISVDALGTNYVTIKSPIIQDGFGSDINKYTLIYCTTNFDNVLGDINLLNSCNEQTFTKNSYDSEMTMRLSNLNSSNIYYAVVVPTDDDGGLGEISNQVCFKLDGQISGNGNECSISDNHTSSSVGANICIVNLTHICESSGCPKGTKATLRRANSCGNDRVDILIYDRDTNDFNRLTTAFMSDESYTFTIPRKGENIIRFQPINGGAYKDYNFQALEASTPTTTTKPTTVKPVVVGPRENIIAVIIGAAILYLAYRIIKRKAE